MLIRLIPNVGSSMSFKGVIKQEAFETMACGIEGTLLPNVQALCPVHCLVFLIGSMRMIL